MLSLEKQLDQTQYLYLASTCRLVTLRCADKSLAWDQRLWLIEVIREDDECWYGYSACQSRQGEPSQFPNLLGDRLTFLFNQVGSKTLRTKGRAIRRPSFYTKASSHELSKLILHLDESSPNTV